MADLVEHLRGVGSASTRPRQRGDVQLRPPRYTIVSVDDHLTEPANMFEGRLPAKFADVAPRVTRHDGADWWVFEGVESPLLGVDVFQTWEPGRSQLGPVTFDDLRPATYDIGERLKDMDISGVAASLCFPSTCFGFAGQVFMRMNDQQLGLAAFHAYNDWIHEEWLSPRPDRVIGCQIPWLNDPVVAAAEIERNAARGFKAVSFSENPYKLGLPSIYDSYWDPFLRACEQTETVINLHVGSSSETLLPSPDSIAIMGILFPINGFAACADWLYAGVPARFPKIRIAMSEGGIGWVPMLLDRIEYSRRDPSAPAVQLFGDQDPVDILRRNFWFTTFSDPRTLAIRHEVGLERIMLETDYPHSDSSWPNTQKILAGQLKALSEEEVTRITWSNAAELYRHPVEAIRAWESDIAARTADT